MVFKLIKQWQSSQQRKKNRNSEIKLQKIGLLLYKFKYILNPDIKNNKIKVEFELPCKFEGKFNADLKIGAYSYTSTDFAHYCPLQIGRFCSIAANVTVGQYNHPIDQISTHPLFFDKNSELITKYKWDQGLNIQQVSAPVAQGVIIGDDVWVGEGVMIHDGVNIGTGAIIGMGAVISEDVPAYAIVGGVPAKIIRYRKTQQPYADEYKSWGVINNDNLQQYL